MCQTRIAGCGISATGCLHVRARLLRARPPLDVLVCSHRNVIRMPVWYVCIALRVWRGVVTMHAQHIRTSVSQTRKSIIVSFDQMCVCVRVRVRVRVRVCLYTYMHACMQEKIRQRMGELMGRDTPDTGPDTPDRSGTAHASGAADSSGDGAESKRAFPNRKLTELAPSSESEDEAGEVGGHKAMGAKAEDSSFALNITDQGSGAGEMDGGENSDTVVMEAFMRRWGTHEVFDKFCGQSETGIAATARGHTRNTMHLREFLSLLKSSEMMRACVRVSARKLIAGRRGAHGHRSKSTTCCAPRAAQASGRRALRTLCLTPSVRGREKCKKPLRTRFSLCASSSWRNLTRLM